MSHELPFYAEYDRLFAPDDAAHRRFKRALWAWVSVAVVVIGGIAASEVLRQHLAGRDTASIQKKPKRPHELTEVLPLQAVGFPKPTVPKTVTPLRATVKEQAIAFNRGQTLTVTGEDVTISHSRPSDLVLPGANSTRPVAYLGDITLHRQGGDLEDYTVKLWGDLVNQFTVVLYKDGDGRAKAFEEPPVGALKTGYIMSYRDSSDSLYLTRYYLYPDGSGFTLRTATLAPAKSFKSLKAVNTTADFKAIFKEQLAFFDRRFIFTP